MPIGRKIVVVVVGGRGVWCGVFDTPCLGWFFNGLGCFLVGGVALGVRVV